MLSGPPVQPPTRVRAESELDYLELYFAGSPKMIGIVECDFERRDAFYTKCNARLLAVFNEMAGTSLTPAELRGKWARADLGISPVFVDQWLADCAEAKAKGAPLCKPESSGLDSTRRRGVLTVYLGENDATGRPVFSFEVSAANSTEYLEALKDDDESQERLRLALEGATNGVWDWDCRTNAIYVSEQIRTMLGLSNEEHTKSNSFMRDLVHPEDMNVLDSALKDHLENKTPSYSAEYRCRCSSGEYIWIHDRGQVIDRDVFMKPLRMIGTVFDLTEKRKTEGALRESEAKWRELTRLVPVVIFRGDVDGNVTFANAYWTDLVGAGTDAALAHGILDFVHPDDRDRVTTHWEQSVVDKTKFRDNFRLVKAAASGQVIVHVTAKFEWVVVNDMPTCFTGAITNVTAEKNAEMLLADKNAALDAALRQAEVAVKAKSEFLANMSHECRTPLHGILGMIRLLRDSATAEQSEMVSALVDCSEGLLTIVDDILDFSKIEAGKLVLEKKPFSVIKCVQGALRMFKLKAHQKGIELSHEICASVPRFIEGDCQRVKQILVNLLGNAVKFTAHGSVRLTVSVDDREEEDGGLYDGQQMVRLAFSVKDTGIGIPEHAKEQLFLSFSQVDSSTSRRYGGTGLGLAISKQLSAMMRGSIGFDSVEGAGSTFRFTILAPVVGAESFKSGGSQGGGDNHSRRASSSPLPATHYPFRILIAEDNIINQKLLVKLLQKFGCDADVANNGQEAVDAALRTRYDLIFMDIMMPILNGLDATEQIRKRVPAAHQPLIVALTANAMPGSREQFLARGLDEYLTKPINMRLLKDTLVQCGRRELV